MANDIKQDIENFPNQVREASLLGKDIKVEKVLNIVTIGVGGSGIPGMILRSYLDLKIPIIVHNDYGLPEIAGKGTLLFAVSYSGNTEETLEAVRTGLRKGCTIVAITSGGKLKELCAKNKMPCVVVPEGLQPRAAVGYLFFPMLNVLQNSGVIENQQENLKMVLNALSNTNFKERAEELASKVFGKIPLIYSSRRFGAISYRWKTQINENAKMHAFNHVLPELDHNELVGFTKPIGEYYVIFIVDEDDYRRIKDRVKITKDLIAARGVKSTEFVVKGECLLARMFSAIHVGDWLSYFLAIKNGVDPTPVNVIRELKKSLGE